MGLAFVALAVGIFFIVRRRRRTQRLERDTAVSASLAAAGFKRNPLDDEDDDPFGSQNHGTSTQADLEMAQRSGSRLDGHSGFDPYSDYIAATPSAGGSFGRTRDGGYAPARTSSPTPPVIPPLAFSIGDYPTHHYNNSGSEDSQRDRRISGTGHVSSSSYEPLLAAYARANASPSPENATQSRPPTPPPRNPLRLTHSRSASPALNNELHLPPAYTPTNDDPPSSRYSSDSIDHDDRLDPTLKQRSRADLQGNVGASTSDLRDDEDYSRPVLAVRNMTTLTDVSTSTQSHS